MEMFERASRLGLRFEAPKGQTPAGQFSVEDLWKLPLSASNGRTNLDDIAVSLYSKLREGADVSFVDKDRKSDPGVQLRFDIVKHIIDVRLAEKEAAAKEHDSAQKRQRILSIIADREDEELRKLPLDELRKAAAG